MKPLKDKVAIVTGASAAKGIGWATAVRLADAGAVVVVTDIAETPGADGRARSNAAALEKLVERLGSNGREAIAATVDVTDRRQIDACVERVCDAYGGIDILVNNAGTTVGARPFLELSSEHWDVSYQVNLKGAADFCQAVIPGLIDRGGGAIVNNASTAGLGAEPGFAAYNATKHGLIGLTKTIAAEFGPRNIRCNAVCPGLILTEMHIAANERIARTENLTIEETMKRRYETVALRRVAEPREVADAIAYLVSPAASYITGVALPVAGGCPVGL